MYYPYSSAQFLNDEIFVNYGGQTGSSLSVQRDIAYALSEKLMTQHLGTYLLPTDVTGSFQYLNHYNYVWLDHTFVNSVASVDFMDERGVSYYTISDIPSRYATVFDSRVGLLDVHHWASSHCCNGTVARPYNLQVVYNAGLQSGTTMQQDMMMALVTGADLLLGEILGYGNEADGLVGLAKFSNQEYSETRLPMVRTGFGTSPRTQLIVQLVSHLNVKRYISL
jgi:hypothetical protein